MSLFDLLSKIYPKPSTVSSVQVKSSGQMSEKDIELMKRIGTTVSGFTEIVQKNTFLNFERLSIYREVERSIQHWMMGSALELYADTATTYSQLHNATVWATAPDNMNTYQRELNNFIDKIGIEEKIFDWAWSIAAFGDLFLRVEAVPGVGIVYVDDIQHPINISRLENNGRLIGFYKTPLGYESSNDSQNLIPPWEYVHFRLLGAKMKRPMYKDQTYTDSITIIAPDIRQMSTHYGTSVLINALPAYKRLRLAEDSLLIARLSKGVLRYIYKVKVDGNNIEAAQAIVDQYADLLKKARAVDTTQGSVNFDEKYNPLSSNEDVIIPVWGDVNNVTFDKVGGECLRGDTKIKMLDGTNPTIKEMAFDREKYVGQDIYACNKKGEIVARRIKDVLMTKPQTKFLRIYLDNGEYFDCTSNHKCMLRDGNFKEAQYLVIGQYLMGWMWNVRRTKELLIENYRKIVNIEKLDIIEDAYDLVIEDAYDRNGGPEHCFALTCGVFVHNSDIKWIVDIEELRNQCSSALRVPLQLLGGYGKELPASLGDSALNRLDIRFSRSVRRLQRAIKEGIKRLCQIHLAYLNYSPDASMFKVEMCETSSAEELELRESLDKGSDVVKKMFDVISGFVSKENLNGIELLNYLNTKILKLGDFDINSYLKNTASISESVKNNYIKPFDVIVNSDLYSHTSLDESVWRELYGKVKIIKKVGQVC